MTDAPNTPDPIEIAMEAEASGRAPAGVAARVLAKQEQLLGWQIARERAQLGVALVAALAGLAVLAAASAMVWRAAHADGVVVRPFTTPTDLAADGLTGEALAAKVLDRINDLRLRTQGTLRQSASGFRDSDADALRLEIPQTGVSIGDLDAYLRRWLGHEKTIGGTLVRSGDTAVLTLRYTGAPAVVVRGPASDLEALITEGADAVFGLADPIRAVLAQPLTPQGHDRAMAYMESLRASPDPQVRRDGYGFSANQTPDPQVALAYIDEAARWGGVATGGRERMAILTGLGNWEDALSAGRAGQAAIKRDHRSGWLPGAKLWLSRSTDLGVARLTGDLGLAERRILEMNNPTTPGARRAPQEAAPVIAQRHDIARARREMARRTIVGHPPTPATIAQVAFAAGDHAAAVTAYAAARAELDDLDARHRAAGWPQSMAGRNRRVPLTAESALALAEGDDLAAAAEMIRPTPPECYPCLLTRARIAWLSGDLAGAEALYARAGRLGPSLPQAHEASARLALARGHFVRAAQLARIAEARGPRWADPLKVEGDALAAAGDRKAALARYDAALRLAPAWAEAKAARARAAR